VRRVLFRVGSVSFYSYPVMLYVGLVIGTLAGDRVARRIGIPADRFVVAVLILLVPALAGARLAFVASHWHLYRDHPRQALRRAYGGMALYGGLILAVAVSVPVLFALDLGFLAFWDAATFTMLAGMIFTRLGCLLNGCCAGRPSHGPLSVRLADHQGIWERRHPTQLFEATLAVALLCGEIALLSQRPPRGVIFLVALLGYGAGRFLLEPLRAPQGRANPALAARTVSGALVAVSLPLLVVRSM
jgi:phosphatidylglycerol:prolipoprotein diacylglycerol transferase